MSSDKLVLVTGGAGFIGSATCKELSKSGYIPIVVDNLETGHIHNVKWGPFYRLDIQNRSEMENVFRAHSFVGVIHLAAKAYVADSMKRPLDYFQTNIVGTLELVKLVVKHKIRAFVFASSCATYGEPKSSIINEETAQLPINPYGLTKLACEQILRSLQKLENWNYATLRYFNASGADLELEYGEEHHPESHIIPRMLDCYLKGEEFTIHGDDFPTVDGTCVRDYVHVSDLAKANVRALSYLAEGGKSVELLLGSGAGTSNLELVQEFRRLGIDLKHRFGSRRAGDPARLVADYTKTKEVLSWEPRHSSIQEILLSATKWKHRNL